MFRITRTSTLPNTPLKVIVDHRDPADPDGGFAGGGSFHFCPAGQDGDGANCNLQAARAIMLDPGLAVHFRCDPPLPGQEQPVEPSKEVAPATTPEPVAATEPAVAPQKRRKGRKRARSQTAG